MDTRDIESVFARQRELATRERLDARARRAALVRLRDALAARGDDLAAALSADLGRNPVETEMVELQLVLREITHAIRHLNRWMRPVRRPTPLHMLGTQAQVRYEPRGVVLLLGPWNYPLTLVGGPLVAALAAGNRVIVKPSERAPRTSRFLVELVQAAFEPDLVAAFEGDASVAERLLALPFDHVFFTGSTRVGRKIMEAASRHLSSVTLELGGKSPVVIDASADVEEAARRIAFGKFINAGQTCVAPDYVLVHESRRDALVAGLERAIARQYGADEAARAASPDLGRIVDSAATERLRRLVEESVAAGARVALGGRFDATSRYASPTVLVDVPPGSPVMREELFGPVLPVLTFQTLDQAITFVNERDKPLALYVFAGDRHVAETVLGRTSAGGSIVNNVAIHLAHPHLPFGGVGPSGMGSYHGESGFRTLSHERAVLVQRGPSLTSLVAPPYGERVRRMVRLLTRLAAGRPITGRETPPALRQV